MLEHPHKKYPSNSRFTFRWEFDRRLQIRSLNCLDTFSGNPKEKSFLFIYKTFQINLVLASVNIFPPLHLLNGSISPKFVRQAKKKPVNRVWQKICHSISPTPIEQQLKKNGATQFLLVHLQNVCNFR